MLLGHVFKESLAAVDPEKPLFSGFSAARDIVLEIGGDSFVELQKRLALALPDPDAPPPGVLGSMDDIAAFLAGCIAHGHGTDVPLAEPEVAAPMEGALPSRQSVGGTGIQVANCLALCGMTRLNTHIPYLAPEMERLLHPAITLHGYNEYYRALMPDRSAFAGTHYILDYAAGARVLTKRGELAAAKPDRLILGGNPYNRKLRIAPEFIELVAAPYPGATLVLAGFNAPREYGDFLAFVDDCVRLLEGFRRYNPDNVLVHVEECHHANQPRERRTVIAEKIWPHVDSVGMNEAEFATLADFMKVDAADPRQGLFAMAAKTGLNRICLHTAARSLAVSRFAPHKEQKALGLGTLMASARAYYGDFPTRENIPAMLEATRELYAATRVPEPVVLEDAYSAVELPSIPALPIKSSIGLGDAFTAGIAAALP